MRGEALQMARCGHNRIMNDEDETKQPIADEDPDGYYGDEDFNVGDLDLRFLDEDGETEPGDADVESKHKAADSDKHAA